MQRWVSPTKMNGEVTVAAAPLVASPPPLHTMYGPIQEHAKWSPVATASYRLLPAIELKEEVRGEKARRLRDCFTAGMV